MSVDKEVKKTYNKKYQEKLKEKIKQLDELKVEEKIEPVIENNDDEEVIELDENSINDMVNKRVKEQMDFFLRNHQTQVKKKVQLVTHSQIPGMFQEISKTILLMSLPIVFKLAMGAIGSKFLKPSQVVLPPQTSTNQPEQSSTTFTPYSLSLNSI